MSERDKPRDVLAETLETYSVAEIREAFRRYAHRDDWGVKSFYEDTLISALRGKYDDEAKA